MPPGRRPEVRSGGRPGPLRWGVEAVLRRGYFDRRVRGFGQALWEHRDRRWVLAEVEGVEPTNRAAERSRRHAVIWRERSFGTGSASGGRFVERRGTVIATGRPPGRDVFAWPEGAVRAAPTGRPIPSLLLGP